MTADVRSVRLLGGPRHGQMYTVADYGLPIMKVNFSPLIPVDILGSDLDRPIEHKTDEYVLQPLMTSIPTAMRRFAYIWDGVDRPTWACQEDMCESEDLLGHFPIDLDYARDGKIDQRWHQKLWYSLRVCWLIPHTYLKTATVINGIQVIHGGYPEPMLARTYPPNRIRGLHHDG